MNYQYIIAHKELFPYVIGITYKQFKKLLPKFVKALRKAEDEKAYSYKRKRKPGGGRKPTLETDEQKLFFILFYYKVYPTFRFAQSIFCFDKRNVQIWVRFLEKALFSAIGYELELPFQRIRSLNHWLEVCPDLKEFIVDGTERPIQRPKDKQKQKDYYSGKKKKHTVKNNIFVDPRNKKILAVSATVERKKHDKRLLEDDSLFTKIPPHSTGMGDSAYQGIKHPFVSMIVPKKKPPGGKFTEEEKRNNTRISSIRTKVEHPFSYMKHFNILAHRFRNRIKHTHLPFYTLACLYNFTRTHR